MSSSGLELDDCSVGVMTYLALCLFEVVSRLWCFRFI